MAKENKPWFKSKTVWVNVLITGAGILTAISGELETGGTITGLGILNLVLRVITNKPLKFN